MTKLRDRPTLGNLTWQPNLWNLPRMRALRAKPVRSAPSFPEHMRGKKVTIQRIEKTERLSRVVVHGGVAYFSGLTAEDRSQDVADQTRQVLKRADELLHRIGADRSAVLSAMIWLRDIADFDKMNAVWTDWILKDEPPARATVQAVLGLPDIAIEIQFTAAMPA